MAQRRPVGRIKGGGEAAWCSRDVKQTGGFEKQHASHPNLSRDYRHFALTNKMRAQCDSMSFFSRCAAGIPPFLACCRELRTKFAEMEQQLDAAKQAQHTEAEQSKLLAAQVERLQGRLRELAAKHADLSQQLW